MKTIFQATFSAFLFTFVASQRNLFIIEILDSSYTTNASTRCAATLFNSTTHAIAPASCLELPPDHLMLIRVSVHRVDGSYSAVATTAMTIESHPYFDPSNPTSYDVGVVHLNFNTSIFDYFRARELSKFPATETICQLHGYHWRNATDDRLHLHQEEVHVLPPENCGNDADFIHCSIFESTDAAACEFMQGSPLICDFTSVAGFVLSKNGCEVKNISDGSGGMKQVVMLRYNSMSVYNQWARKELTTPQPDSGSLVKLSIASMILSLIIVLIVK